MDLREAARYSLADFFVGDTDDVLVPPAEYSEWRAATTWATALYERSMLGAPAARVEVEANGDKWPVINLASYNYLGLATHPETVAAAKSALDRYGTGACGSPILSGMTDLHRQLEAELAAFLGRESVMLFNSGFGGALGALSGLLRKGDACIVDSKSHLCLIDGTRLSGAALVTFAHNDPRALDAALSRAKGKRRLVVLEGIYSMDGDVGALPELVRVAEEHGAPVFIDEAHSILTLGVHGRGAVESCGVEGRVGLQYATFSKAFASVGSFVAGSKATLDYLRFYANPYGFSCALPPAVAAAALAGLRVATRDDLLRVRLRENAAYFRRQLRAIGLDTGESTSHVVPIILGKHRELLYMLSYALLSRGLFLAPVDYPSVPDDQVRFRASITAAHTKAELDEALDILELTVARALRAAA